MKEAQLYCSAPVLTLTCLLVRSHSRAKYDPALVDEQLWRWPGGHFDDVGSRQCVGVAALARTDARARASAAHVQVVREAVEQTLLPRAG